MFSITPSTPSRLTLPFDLIMCWFHDILCVCGTKIEEDDSDCANYLLDLPCGEYQQEPKQIVSVEQLCLHCQLDQWRWPEVDITRDMDAGYR